MSLGETIISRTVFVRNECEGLIRIAVGAVHTLSNIVHELWGCSRRFTIEGDGNGGGLQESEQRTIFIDSEELLVDVIPLGPSKSPGVCGNREDVRGLGRKLTP